MDEPLSNLDARLRVQMRGELKRLQHQLSTTTIYVTHDQAEAMTLAHRVAVMHKGRLQQFDTPMTIYERPANRFVAEFVGSPSMNFVEGEVDQAKRVFAAKDVSIPLNDSQLDGLAKHNLRSITIGVRPEHIEINSNSNEAIEATIYVTELMGNETFVFLNVGNHRLIARAPAEFRADVESKVRIRFTGEKLHFFDSQTNCRVSI
jgi:ABC-type sugar transport system ATPase subunit